MLNHVEFGKRLKYFRKSKDFTQKEIAFRIGVSEQAISKWENGECLPDVYNLKLLGKVLHTSVDTLLDTEGENPERIVEIIQIGGAVFEIIEKPETILAGKILYAKEYQDIDAFYQAIDTLDEEEKQTTFRLLQESVLPLTDIQLSVNFWRDEDSRAFGSVREVTTEDQPKGVDVYKMPASLLSLIHI